MNNSHSRSKFGCFNVTKRRSAILAFEKVKNIHREQECEVEETERAVSPTLSSVSNYSTTSFLNKIKIKHCHQRSGEKQQSPSSFVKMKINLDNSDGSGNRPQQPGSSNGSNNGQTQKKRGPKQRTKTEEINGGGDSKENIIGSLPIPVHIKISIQLMLNVNHGFRGLSIALVESEFYHIYPNLCDFKHTDHGFLNFETMLKSPQMKTHCYTNRVQNTPTIYGHPLTAAQGKLEYNSESKTFSITLNENHQGGHQPMLPVLAVSSPPPQNQQQQKQIPPSPMILENKVEKKSTPRQIAATIVSKPSTSTTSVPPRPQIIIPPPVIPAMPINATSTPPTMQFKKINTEEAPKMDNNVVITTTSTCKIINKNDNVSVSRPTMMEAATTTNETTENKIVVSGVVALIQSNPLPVAESIAQKVLKNPEFKTFLDNLVNECQKKGNDDEGGGNTNGIIGIDNVVGQGQNEASLFLTPPPTAPGSQNFYRRQELPDTWSQLSDERSNNIVGSTSSHYDHDIKDDERGTSNYSRNYYYNQGSSNRGRKSNHGNINNYRGRRPDNRNRYFEQLRPPLLPDPEPTAGSSRTGGKMSRWGPTSRNTRGRHYKNYRPEFVKRRRLSDEADDDGWRHNYQPKNPVQIQQNKAVSFSILRQANARRLAQPSPIWDDADDEDWDNTS